jgi:hypothetical protein
MEPDAPQYKGLRLRQKAGYVMATLQQDAEELQKASGLRALRPLPSTACVTALWRSWSRLAVTSGRFRSGPGHNSLGFTLTRYGGLFENGSETAVDRLDLLLGVLLEGVRQRASPGHSEVEVSPKSPAADSRGWPDRQEGLRRGIWAGQRHVQEVGLSGLEPLTSALLARLRRIPARSTAR